MKSRLLLLLNAISFWTLGQSELTTNNPAPRVGDEIEITFRLKDSKDDIGNGEIKISKTLSEAGQIKIGPFKFTIADKTYETDILTINVSPKLPDDKKDGLWIRLVKFKNSEFLIIEQRISNQWKRERKSENETTMTHGDGVEYADFKKEILEENGIDIVASSSSTSSQIVDKKDILGQGTVSYKIQSYKFKRTDKFKNKIRIDKTSFTNYPDNVTVDTISIE